MKIQRLEVFPGKEGDIKKGKATNDYSEGRLTICQDNTIQEYKFPFGCARFLRIKEITSLGLKQLGILLLNIHPLVWDTVAPYEIGNWPPYKKSCLEIKEFSEMSQNDLDYYAHYAELYLEEIGKTIYEGIPKKNFGSTHDEKLQDLAIEKIITGMRQKYSGLCLSLIHI